MFYPIFNIIQFIYTFQFINLKLSISIIKLYDEIFEVYLFLLQLYTFESTLYTDEYIYEPTNDSNKNSKNAILNGLFVQAQAESFTYKFTGKELDEETGYYYFGARYYDPQISSWISTDPALSDYIPTGMQLYFPDKAFNANSLKGSGGVFKSLNMNLYHYASCNPVKFIDPDGKTPADNEIILGNIENYVKNYKENGDPKYLTAINLMKSKLDTIKLPSNYAGKIKNKNDIETLGDYVNYLINTPDDNIQFEGSRDLGIGIESGKSLIKKTKEDKNSYDPNTDNLTFTPDAKNTISTTKNKVGNSFKNLINVIKTLRNENLKQLYPDQNKKED